jgi:hypothetical protein
VEAGERADPRLDRRPIGGGEVARLGDLRLGARGEIYLLRDGLVLVTCLDVSPWLQPGGTPGDHRPSGRSRRWDLPRFVGDPAGADNPEREPRAAPPASTASGAR